MGKSHQNPCNDAWASKRHDNVYKRIKRMAAKRCGNFHRPITDALKGRHQRLHHEGHRINHRPDDQSGEAEIKRSQPERLREHPQRTVRTQGNENVKAQYGWRKYERQRDYRIDCRTPTALAAGQPPRERQPYEQQHQSRYGRKLKRELHWRERYAFEEFQKVFKHWR